MTDMNKNKEFTISCDSTIATRSEELENDPKFIMVNDGKVKKASIYHPPPSEAVTFLLLPSMLNARNSLEISTNIPLVFR